MANKFGSESLRQLGTCDSRLWRLAHAALAVGPDFSILEGHRGKAAQNAAFASGASQLPWPKGRHNASPSRAFDFSPYPQDWSDKTTALARFVLVAGIMLAEAKRLGIKIRLGFDWNRNFDPRDESFLDWGHVELDEP